MKSKRRWLNSVLEESTKQTVALPWARGTRPTRTRAVAAPRQARG